MLAEDFSSPCTEEVAIFSRLLARRQRSRSRHCGPRYRTDRTYVAAPRRDLVSLQAEAPVGSERLRALVTNTSTHAEAAHV